MSTMQRMTLIGLYNNDATLFDGLVLPTGYDLATFRDSLLLAHGEKCVLYQNPDFMKNAIALWGAKWSEELERIYNALTAEYNPLHNYDRNEEYTDNEGTKRLISSDAGHKATDSPDISVAQTVAGTVEHEVSADNSSTYQPDYKDTSNAGTTKTSGKSQDLNETSNAKTNEQVLHDYKHKAHLYGNIGVTTSVQMWSEEVQARFKYNLYDVAGAIFAKELLIGLW